MLRFLETEWIVPEPHDAPLFLLLSRLWVSGVIKRHGNKTPLSIILHAEPSPISAVLYQYAERTVQTYLCVLPFTSAFYSLSFSSCGRTTHPLPSSITDTRLALVCVCVFCVCRCVCNSLPNCRWLDYVAAQANSFRLEILFWGEVERACACWCVCGINTCAISAVPKHTKTLTVLDKPSCKVN